MIFRYNPNGQEAVVPLESRNASAYLLAFDNTSSTATGIAINSVSPQSREHSGDRARRCGNQLATDTLTLQANGHLAFTLARPTSIPQTPTSAAPSSSTRRPARQIGALGIRIPVAHTFTTLPALAK